MLENDPNMPFDGILPTEEEMMERGANSPAKPDLVWPEPMSRTTVCLFIGNVERKNEPIALLTSYKLSQNRPPSNFIFPSYWLRRNLVNFRIKNFLFGILLGSEFGNIHFHLRFSAESQAGGISSEMHKDWNAQSLEKL